jgi:asparagine synthase (glutamine-hydrolysing)
MGFAVPLADWFRGPLGGRVRRALTGRALAETGTFDTGFVTRLLDQHQSGTWDHSTAIWALIMFEAFLRQAHTAPAYAPSAAEPLRPTVATAAGAQQGL